MRRRWFRASATIGVRSIRGRCVGIGNSDVSGRAWPLSGTLGDIFATDLLIVSQLVTIVGRGGR